MRLSRLHIVWPHTHVPVFLLAGVIPELNLLVHEYAAYALRNLTFQSEDGQEAILSCNGAKVFLDLASSYCSSSEHAKCCSVVETINTASSDASEELHWLTADRKLVGRVGVDNC